MRSGLPHSKLRSRILVWVSVPTVIALAVVAIITFLAYEEMAQQEMIGRDRERTYLAANRLKEEMAKFSGELLTLARTEAMYQDDPNGQRAALNDARRRLSVFDGGVVLLDNFGRVRGSQPFRPEIFLSDWSDRIYFRRLLAGESVVFSNALPDGPGGAPVIVIAVPITNAYGEFLGALAGMFRLGEPTISVFYASILRLRSAEHGDSYLVDGNGQVIFHPETERIGQDLLADPVVDKVLAGQVGAFRDSSRDSQDVVVSFAPVPGTPWGLVIEEDWAAHTSTSRRYGQFLLFLLVLGIVLPTVGFGLFAYVRRAEALERARLEQQMRVARLIQQTLLPRQAPDLPGWRVCGHYQPAQAVGGDFYDFLYLEDGRLGLIIGDVTDKGVPAALVMASTRGLLRSAAQSSSSPGQVLQQANDLLLEDIPPKMFVTCLYAILDPANGQLRYANAGHNLPYRSHPCNGDVAELRAIGMPLGLMPGMVYEEVETTLSPGECVLFYSDGLVEAHNSRREMFGSPRLKSLLGDCSRDCPTLIQHLLAELRAFTGRGWEQEDDVTLVTLQRAQVQEPGPIRVETARADSGWHTLAEFSLTSEPGNEHEAMRRVVEAVEGLDLSKSRLERLKTAVAETTSNAIEHGNRYQPELPVSVQVLASEDAVMVRVTDQGDQPLSWPEAPDLEAKVNGLQRPRGWGLFLIQKMVDELKLIQGDGYHTFELVLLRKGEQDAHYSA